ncbi:hypothetical protein V8C86DRAFT_2456482 [Haematococcus lacustris]
MRHAVLSLESLQWPQLPEWWQRVEQDPQFQVYANWGIAAAYGLIGLVALVQLIRIHLRVPEYGMTTQKVFHLLNCLVCTLRAGIFLYRGQMEDLHPQLVKILLLDLPGLLFFTTYTLLVLFWAEIYHQARSMPTGALRPIFVVLNLLVYATQVGLWTMSTWPGQDAERQRLGFVISDVFLAVMSAGAAAGFLLYGGRLFLMLQRFPIESRGRRKKLREVGLVTTICAGCFSFRAVMVSLSAFDLQDLELDMLGHPLLNMLYYSLVEILPTACVLYILRKLPPKRTTQGYQQIPAQ